MMIERFIGRYEKRIAEEEKLADEAPSAEAALGHAQAALIYRTDLAVMRKQRAATFGQMLAELG